MTLPELDDQHERTQALRALLAAPFLDAGERAYALVRRHERELATTLQSVYGYQLAVGSTAARALGAPTSEGLRRPLRIEPASTSGRRRAPDEWAALSDRGCVLLLLTLTALERAGAQIALAELAREAERAGSDVDPPVSVDFRERSERSAFADGLDVLCSWGVIEHTSGSHDSYARRQQNEDEALFTIDRRRLALLVRDPARALESTSIEELLDESARHPPTPEGENRLRFERCARRLGEDPALLLSDLEPDERAYFLGQRARIETAVSSSVGYEVERRAEGSALIVDDRGFTDLPFPTNSTVKQVALLLCDTLASIQSGGELSAEALRDAVAELMAEHGRHWGRDADDPVQVTGLTAAAAEVLIGCDLARPTETRGLRPTPLAARFREPLLRSARTEP